VRSDGGFACTVAQREGKTFASADEVRTESGMGGRQACRDSSASIAMISISSSAACLASTHSIESSSASRCGLRGVYQPSASSIQLVSVQCVRCCEPTACRFFAQIYMFLGKDCKCVGRYAGALTSSVLTCSGAPSPCARAAAPGRRAGGLYATPPRRGLPRRAPAPQAGSRSTTTTTPVCRRPASSWRPGWTAPRQGGRSRRRSSSLSRSQRDL
jgi:hypothetical protein